MKKKWVYFIVIVMIGLFLFAHTNSDRALRFKVFVHGFSKEAFNSDIEYVFKDDEGNKYYVLDPTPVSKETGPTNAWKVKRMGILYFASYFGA